MTGTTASPVRDGIRCRRPPRPGPRPGRGIVARDPQKADPPIPRSTLRPASPCAFVASLAAVAVLAGPVHAQRAPPGLASPLAASAEADLARADWIFLEPGAREGSAAVFSPAAVYLNRGFSTLVWTDAERRLGHIDWGGGLATVWDALSDPGSAIQRAGGWRTWLHNETLPSGHILSWAFSSNFAGHVVAGGISHRHMAEWFEAQGVPAPWLMAAAVGWGAIFTNEVVEAANSRPGAPGPASTVADLYLWDPLGMLLFSNDAVARFFAEELRAADWSPVASLTFPGARIQNVAQLMKYGLPVPGVDGWEAFMLIGQGHQAGLMGPGPAGTHVGGTLGFSARQRLVDPDTNFESIRATWTAAGYLSRDNSLLASVTYTKAGREALQANLYPGVLPGPLGALAVWFTHTRTDGPAVGLSVRPMGGLGVGWGGG